MSALPSQRDVLPGRRGATIELEQLPTGYWKCEVAVRMQYGEMRHAEASFHDAGECMVWGDQQVRFLVSAASGWVR